MTGRYIQIFGSNFKMVKDQCHLFIWRWIKEISTICITWIITRISRGIKISPFSRGTSIFKCTGTIWFCCSRYFIFCFKGIPVYIKTYITNIYNKYFSIIYFDIYRALKPFPWCSPLLNTITSLGPSLTTCSGLLFIPHNS